MFTVHLGLVMLAGLHACEEVHTDWFTPWISVPGKSPGGDSRMEYCVQCCLTQAGTSPSYRAGSALSGIT
jgi:hypothetical protein